jgi:hypothetical protein
LINKCPSSKTGESFQNLGSLVFEFFNTIVRKSATPEIIAALPAQAIHLKPTNEILLQEMTPRWRLNYKPSSRNSGPRKASRNFTFKTVVIQESRDIKAVALV